MDLFIGNATRQVYDFSYRALESMHLRSQKIQPGTYTKVSGDLSTEEIDHILKQHAPYGIVPDSTISQVKQFHGTCYSVGKPPTRAKLIYLMEHNLDQLVKRGEQIRRTHAVAQSNMINGALIDSGREERVSALDLTVQQENQDPGNSVPQMSVGMYVTADGEAKPKGARRARRA